MKIAGILCLLVINVGAVSADEKPIPRAEFSSTGHSVDALVLVKQRITEKTAVLIDVREQDEWTEGHLNHAKLIPLSILRSGLTQEIKDVLPKDKPIYCHCASGSRVLTAAKILRPMGYDIRPLKSGYEKLVTEGFEKAVSAKP